MLDNKKIEIPNANELELNTQLKERDDQLSELSIQLQHTLEQMQETETAFDARVTSQRKKIQHLESELDQCILTINCKTVQMTEMSKVNKHLEKNVKENDGIIRKQGDQLNCTLNRLQEKETEFVGTNISLKKKEQELERLDQKVKDLEETLAKMRTEINGGNEHLLNQVKEKDKQLSDLSDQLHEAFEQLHENDIKQGETITSLKQENVHLVARVNSSEMQVYTLEKMLDNTISEITDINERSANNAANENDDQISDMKVQLDLTLKSMHDKESDLNGLITTLKKKSREKDDQMLELSVQLTRTLNQLHDKETEMRQNDIVLQKKQKYIEEEVDDNKWKIKHLEELLNRKENEMTQIIHKNKLLEKKLMENYKSISERDQTLKNLDLTVKELEKIINNRDLTVKDLEEKLQKMRTEIRDGSDSLVIEVKDKDQQLSKQAARLQQILNQLHEKESELGGTISLLKRQIQGKDDHISELKQALKLLGDREFEMKEIDTSLRTKLDYLEKELERREREVEKHLEDILNSKTAEITKMSAQNEYLENKVKEKDELIDQRDRVLKKQQEAKTELCGIITSLQKKNEDLGTDINDRDLTVKDLEKRLERMRMEISGGNERLILAMTEKDKQISKQAAKLQHALNKLHETEAELGGIITSLKKQIQGKDDQISKLGDQLKQTLKLLDDKESEVKEIDATLRKKIEYLLERRERKAETHLQEMLNRKTAEITKMRAETDLLEIKLKENDKQSDQRDRILRRLQKAETESSRIINSLQEKNYGLDTDIKGRDKKVKDLEEKNAKMKTESRVENERLIMEVMGKDKQISEQTLRLEQALSQFHVKETKLGETIISLRTECQAKDGLISELRDQLKQTLEKLDVRDSELKEIETSLQEMERQKRKAEIHLKEMLKNTNVEKSNVRERNETLENKVKEKDKQLIEQRDQLRQTVKQMNETQDKLDGVITPQKKTIQHLQREVERRDLKINDIEKLLHSIKTESRGNQQSEAVIEKEVKIAELKDQLQKTLTTLQDTEAELDETKTRLSKAMGDRLTDNNPNITDLSDKNRPTKLAERCAELYDNQWTDAFDILDKYFDTEENVIGALLEILQDTMTFCIKRAHEQMEELGRELKFADQHGNGDVSADVRKLLKDCRKAVAPVAVGNLYTMYESRLKRSTDKTLRTALEVSSYTSECLEICWFMMIQDPPVAFAPLLRKGSSFNTDLYKPYTSSGTNIDYVVWPPLLLHESGPILAKGVAQGYGKKSKKSAE
ncbi:putative leucine-rich repeat-containing protein DDB_G0290503 [Mercenaria mercenaria]|uniref:putative leucine-rich repeat-containing protein DDB_G0290503 n=1 Tax=Mercenaria mercenaria TaxID=6596 RepID=UPI00234FAEEF|nr:putative leucine-rich repeat-containing protein DDB_G0290503 [Mercenaria mercenaria]